MTLSEYFEFLDPDTVATYPEHLRAAHDYLALAFRLNDLSNYPRAQVLVKEYLNLIEANRQQKDEHGRSSLKGASLNAPTRIEKRRSALLDERQVDNLQQDLLVIKKYISFQGRKISKEKVRDLLNHIRRARLKGQINEDSEFYEEVKSIQENLLAAHKRMRKPIEFDLDNYGVLVMLTHPIRLRLSVRLLKRYIVLGGKRKEEAEQKARELLKEMDNALKKNKITSDDPFYSEVKDARDTLWKFLNSSRKTMPIVEAELYGLDELPDDLKRTGQLSELNLCNEDEY